LEHAEAAKEQAAETRRKAETQLVKMVARELGHTISTCRSAYLHPAILDYALNNTVAPGKAKGELEPYEVHLLDVLDKLRKGAQKP
jgi:DNA topoisomerase-1